jgi:hypothetical protein
VPSRSAYFGSVIAVARTRAPSDHGEGFGVARQSRHFTDFNDRIMKIM